MRTVRLFVSSPSDVLPERERVQWVADRLNGEFSQTVKFETIRWENSVYNAHGSFQDQIDNRTALADCDLVITIFWGRLGSPLSDSFPVKMPDGKPYPSGTAYEVLTALDARKANKERPEVYVFRKSTVPSIPIDQVQEAQSQWLRLEEFFSRHFEDGDKRILRAVEKFDAMGAFEAKVERILRDWIDQHASPGTKWSIEEKGSPFRGLEPFDFKHADVYCGRDRTVMRAIDELKKTAKRGKPFLLIPGASGSGKSSLMRAGMAPRFAQRGAVDDADFWRIAVMRPGSEGGPLLALAQALFVTGDPVQDDPGGFGKALPELADGGFKTPADLAALFSGVAKIAGGPLVAALDAVGSVETSQRKFERPLRVNLLLLVDQFEDIFSTDLTVEQRGRFANLLEALVNTQRVWVVATLRGDMYERMITERPFLALKDMGGQFDLGPPGTDELDEIVHRSAERAGLRYEERVEAGSEGECRERLDDRLLREADSENKMPLLQFALDLLFEKCWGRQRSRVLSIAAYEEIGGMDGAINQTAELALARLVRPGANVQFPLGKDVEDDIARLIDPSLEVLLRKLVVPVGPDHQREEASAERALAARLAPIEEVTAGGSSGELVDALLRARILLASQSPNGSCLRIAHDRVMTSWDRARAIIERNREFIRVKESIEHERQCWVERGRSNEFLIPAGAPITLAEEAVRRFGNEFSEDSRTFVTVSSRRARLRQRLMTAATLVFALVAVLATGASYYATQQRRKATENYVAARNTVEGLVGSIAQKLRDREGIRVETINQALDQVGGLVDNLERQNADDPELRRIRASMHHEFARAFQNSRHLDLALKEAEKGLALREDLEKTLPGDRRARADLAQSLVQVGDICREEAKPLGPKSENGKRLFDESAERFGKAHGIWVDLHTEETDNPTWAFGLSQSLVRLGDHQEWPLNKPDIASGHYRRALELIVEVIANQPDSEDVQHELGWVFYKVGQILEPRDLPACLDMYQKALCTRRNLAHLKPDNTLYKRDVAWSLHRIGMAKSRHKDFKGAAESLFGALELRHQLVKADNTNVLWLIEFGETVQGIGSCLGARGEYDLAGGFNASILERLEGASEKDVREKHVDRRVQRVMRDAKSQLENATRRLSAGTGARAQEIMRKSLKALADRRMELEIETARNRRESIKPLLEWDKLRANLTRPVPAAHDRGN